MNFRGQLHDGGEGGRFDRVAKSRRESHGANHAQLVFAKALLGVADGANDSGSQIIAPADEVEDFVGFGIEQQRVDREIAPLHIFLRRFRVNDAIGVPAVGVADIGAKRGDLDLQGVAGQPNFPRRQSRRIARPQPGCAERAAERGPASRRSRRHSRRARARAECRARIRPRNTPGARFAQGAANAFRKGSRLAHCGRPSRRSRFPSEPPS